VAASLQNGDASAISKQQCGTQCQDGTLSRLTLRPVWKITHSVSIILPRLKILLVKYSF